MIALDFSLMGHRCNLYNKLRLGYELYWWSINEKLWAMNIYNTLQNRVTVTLYQGKYYRPIVLWEWNWKYSSSNIVQQSITTCLLSNWKLKIFFPVNRYLSIWSNWNMTTCTFRFTNIWKKTYKIFMGKKLVIKFLIQLFQMT